MCSAKSAAAPSRGSFPFASFALAGALALLTLATATRAACDSTTDIIACSSQARNADPCCVPRAGLLLFRQRFEPDHDDEGKWGIDGVQVLECDGSPATKASHGKLGHEEIGSLCARSSLLDADAAESAWAQSEVGEGVEEVWERAWNTAGRFVSSLCDGDADVPRFFAALDALHARLKTGALLEKADIWPAEDTTYSRADISAALSVDGHHPVLVCDNATLTEVHWPVYARGNLATFVPADNYSPAVDAGTACPAVGVVYPPAAVAAPSPTPTWDEIYRPTMPPITRSADEARRVQYDDEGRVVDRLKFFKKMDERRNEGDHGHDKYQRDEL